MFNTIRVGHSAPSFTVKAFTNGSCDELISLSDFQGKWVILFFYPADFTTICPTEVKSFQTELSFFKDRNTVVLGASVDSPNVHKAWSKELGGIDFPLLSDVHHTLCIDYNVFIEEDAQALRGTFIISPEGILKWISVSDRNVGRSIQEIKRVLEAL
ncbi:MAG: peroxiredoxin [Patescibacteria group bacterium]